MEDISNIGIIFLLLSLAGFYAAYLYGRKTNKFRWREYLALLAIPVLGVAVLSWVVSASILLLFVLSACTGLFFEYIIGLAYHKTLGKRLWYYERFGLHGYTSLLAFPLWGIVGVWFWFLSELLGL